MRASVRSLPDSSGGCRCSDTLAHSAIRAMVSARRQRRRVLAVTGEGLAPLASRAGPREQVWGVREVVGAEHHVDVRRPLAHQIAVLLGEAAPVGELQAGTPVLELREPPEMPVE